MFGDKKDNTKLLQQHLDDTQIQTLETGKTNQIREKKKQLAFNQTCSLLTLSDCISEDIDNYVTQQGGTFTIQERGNR